MSRPLSLLPRDLSEDEKALGIVQLQGEEFRNMVSIVMKAYEAAEEGLPNDLKMRAIGVLLADIVKGGSSLVPSVEKREFTSVYIEGMPLWLALILRDIFWMRNIGIECIIGGKLYQV